MTGPGRLAPHETRRQKPLARSSAVEQVEQQPLQEVVVRVQLQGVSDNNLHRNEIECAKVFRVGSQLWVSLPNSAFTDDSTPQKGEQAWLSLRYIGGNNMLRKYEWIMRQTYMERKDGIQRQR